MPSFWHCANSSPLSSTLSLQQKLPADGPSSLETPSSQHQRSTTVRFFHPSLRPPPPSFLFPLTRKSLPFPSVPFFSFLSAMHGSTDPERGFAVPATFSVIFLVSFPCLPLPFPSLPLPTRFLASSFVRKKTQAADEALFFFWGGGVCV